MLCRALIVVLWVACGFLTGCGGGAESTNETPSEGLVHEVPGDGGYDLSGDWNRATDRECTGSAYQEEMERFGLIEDGLSGADRLTIWQDGEALVFEAGDHYSHSVREAGGIITSTADPCWIIETTIPTSYAQGCLMRDGVVLEGGSVIEMTELYETGGGTLTCAHEWEFAGAVPPEE